MAWLVGTTGAFGRKVIQQEVHDAIQLSEEDGGKVLVVHAIGKLVKTDYPPFVAEFERRVQKPRKQHVLFDMTGLHGWGCSNPALRKPS